MELPDLFASRMRDLLGREYDDFYETVSSEGPVKGLRVNRKKVSPELFSTCAGFQLRPIPYTDGGFTLPSDSDAGKHPFHHAGGYYLQDPGAMATVASVPGEILHREGLRVLDLCAAPGGKTTQLAETVGKRSVIWANECNPARCRVLAGNVERLGLENVCVLNLDTKTIASFYPGYFDFVLTDVPCSGEGMFRKNGFAVEDWSAGKVSKSAEVQAGILEDGAACVAPGGYLLYSTCTYEIEENEGNVATFLARHPEFHLCPLDEKVVSVTADGTLGGKNGNPEIGLCRRFYPHRFAGEGQFMALLRRDGDDSGVADGRRQRDRDRKNLPGKSAFQPLSKADAAIVAAFAEETFGETPDGFGLCGGRVCCLPGCWEEDLLFPPFGLVAAGATWGELRKGRLVPGHHLFTARGALMRYALPLLITEDSDAVFAYLAGEELSVPGSYDGFCAVLVGSRDQKDGPERSFFLTLGGGKASGGRLKNYYPKGLRVR